jgi:hypothetical protein
VPPVVLLFPMHATYYYYKWNIVSIIYSPGY